MTVTDTELQVRSINWQDPAIASWQNWATGSSLTPFAFPAYQQVYSQFLSSDYQSLILGVWQGAELVAVLSGHRQADQFWLAGMLPLFQTADITDYGDLAVNPHIEITPEISQKIWQVLYIALREQGITHIQLDNLRPDSYLAQALQLKEELKSEKLTVTDFSESGRVEPQAVSPYLSVPATWEMYLTELPKKDRGELRRKLKRLEMEQPLYYFESVENETLTGQSIVDFVRLHRLSDPAKAQFMTQEMATVFEALARTHYEGGWRWELGFLAIAGQRVAAVAYFIRPGDRILLYNSGYDPAFRQLSVGVAIKAQLVKVAQAEQCTEYDFLRGSERYKYDLGAQSRQLFQVKLETA